MAARVARQTESAPVAGDDEEAKSRVIDLVDALGFDAFDADAARAAIAAARPEEVISWRDAVRARAR
jgi:predicted dinucleotide-binding enzyme